MTAETSNARGDVRGLVDVVSDLRHSAVVDDYEIDQIAFLNSIADRIEAALAAEGVQAGEVSAEDVAVLHRIKAALPNVGVNGWHVGAQALERVLAALSQQPEARDVVDVEAIRSLAADMMAVVSEVDDIGALGSHVVAFVNRLNALTGERNG